MINERVSVSHAAPGDAPMLGYVSAVSLIDATKKGSLPICDLHLEQSRWLKTIPDPNLVDVVADRRRPIFEEQLDDHNRRVLIARAEGCILGSVGVRFPPETPSRATIYGLTVLPNRTGRGVAYELMKGALNVIKDAPITHGKNISQIRTGRYDMSERRHPVGQMFASMVNRVRPNSITAEPFEWNGERGVYFHLSPDLYEELLDEFGPKMEKFLS